MKVIERSWFDDGRGGSNHAVNVAHVRVVVVLADWLSDGALHTLWYGLGA